MPAWKKVIVSGSDAALNSLYSPSITGSLLGTASFSLTASNITPAISNDADTRVLTANGDGTLNAESLLTFDGSKLSVLYQSGDEGGEILLNKPVTNTSLTGSGVTIDVYQNKIRFFEQGGAARGAYIDLTAAAGGAGTNLLSGSGGGATFNGGTNVNNRLITATGTSPELNGEAALTFDGSALTMTGSFNISGSIFNPNSIHFYTTASGVTQVGQLGWDDGAGTLDLMLKGGNVNVELGQENVVLVFNNTGTTLNKGEVVFVSGSQGNRPSVNRAIGTTDGYSATTLGFTAESILSGAEGYVTTFGFINNINTSGTIGGSPVWLSPTTPGGWTTTQPQAPQHTVLLGYIVRVHNTVGSIFTHISNGWEIGELHDVRETTTTSSFGDILVKSGSVWISGRQLTGSYGLTGSLSATSFTGSLLGTASFATSASYAPVFPYTGSAQITGSLGVTGSFSVNNGTNVKLDTATSTLTDDSNISSVDWQNRISYDTTQLQSIDWQNRYLLDTAGNISSDWTNRVNLDSSGNTSINWENRRADDTGGNPSIDWSGTSGLNIVNYRPTIEISNETSQDEFIATTTGFGSIASNFAGKLIEVGPNIDLAVTASNTVFLDTDGVWKLADQSTDNTTKLLGICTNGYVRGGILIDGIVTVTTSSAIIDVPYVRGSNFYGMPVYLTGSQSSLTTTKPTSGYVRVVGHMYYNSATTPDYWIMKFNPSNDWYEI
jgi:hypothetical protein